MKPQVKLANAKGILSFQIVNLEMTKPAAQINVSHSMNHKNVVKTRWENDQ